MNTRDTSLLELMFPQGHGVPDPVWSKILLTPAIIPVLASFSLDMATTVKTQIRDSIGTLFQMSLLDVLVSGWKKYAEVSQALEKSKQTPDDTVLESLANHTFKSVHHPYIALYKADAQVGKIEFETTVALNVEGVQLRIRNGEITGILTGSCQGSVQLAFAGQVLSEAQTGRIALPGSVAVTPAARPADVTIALPEEPREQVARVQVAPPPDLPEQGVQQPAPQNPLLMKRTVPAQVSNEPARGTPPPLPPQSRSRKSNNAILLVVGIIAVVCICTSIALLLLVVRPLSIAQVIPATAPALRPPPTSAPILVATVAPPPTSAPFLIATVAPAPTIIGAPTLSGAPTLPAAPPPTEPPAPPPTLALLPTPTTAPAAAPTLPPPGLYVTSIGMDQAQPAHGQLVNFTVSFLNTTGGDLNVKWRVYIYRADTPNRSNTDSAPVQATLHPGPTQDQPVPMNFKYGSSGNACDYFFARVDTLDSSNKPTGELTTTDGKVFQKDFTVCN